MRISWQPKPGELLVKKGLFYLVDRIFLHVDRTSYDDDRISLQPEGISYHSDGIFLRNEGISYRSEGISLQIDRISYLTDRISLQFNRISYPVDGFSLPADRFSLLHDRIFYLGIGQRKKRGRSLDRNRLPTSFSRLSFSRLAPLSVRRTCLTPLLLYYDNMVSFAFFSF